MQCNREKTCRCHQWFNFKFLAMYYRHNNLIIMLIHVNKHAGNLQIVKRGAAPEGGGEVTFNCPCRQKLRPLKFIDPGKIKRIRGMAYPLKCTRIWILFTIYTWYLDYN
jgi:hypothetical protein